MGSLQYASQDNEGMADGDALPMFLKCRNSVETMGQELIFNLRRAQPSSSKGLCTKNTLKR